MIPDSFLPVANHLWQSTVFACAAGLLTLALRKNRARVRHRIWVVVSGGRSLHAHKRQVIAGLACVLIAGTVIGVRVSRAGEDMSHFEVASVKLDTRDFRSLGDDANKCRGGPGTESPTLWVCYLVNPGLLIHQGYGPEVYQFITPLWMDSIHLAISARVPAGATKDQFREMQRNLLIERLHFAWHWKDTEATVYRLVRDPSGVKLHESAPDAPAAVVDYGMPPGVTTGKDHYPVLPEGISALVGRANHNVWRMSNVTTADIAWVLRWEFRTDVIDETGLTGHYDVDLKWETPPMENPPAAPPWDGPDAKTEFRNKLGLRLEPAKGTIKTFVVDHLDRVPVDN